jgi:hypothetical protein
MTVTLLYSIYGLLGVIIATFVAPYIVASIPAIKLEYYKYWAKIFINLAETKFNEGGQGAVKLQFAIDAMQAKFKLKMTDEEILGFIQAVYNDVKGTLEPAKI